MKFYPLHVNLTEPFCHFSVSTLDKVSDFLTKEETDTLTKDGMVVTSVIWNEQHLFCTEGLAKEEFPKFIGFLIHVDKIPKPLTVEDL